MTPHDAARKMRDEAARVCRAIYDERRKRGSYPCDMGGLALECADAIAALPLPAADDAGEGECPACLGMKEYFNPATGMRRMVPCPECRGTGRPATPPPAATGDGNEVTRARDAVVEAARLESMAEREAVEWVEGTRTRREKDADVCAARLSRASAIDALLAAERAAKGGAKP